MMIAYWIRVFSALALASILASPEIPRVPTDVTQTYYTVQVHAVPTENRAALQGTEQSLREQGLPVYRSRTHVETRSYVRLRTGLFESRTQARAYRQRLRVERGLDPFVTEAHVQVDFGRDGTLVATTPSGIWRRSGASWNELYHCEPNDLAPLSTARVSPAGTHVVFSRANRIVLLDLETTAITVLKEGTGPDELLNCELRWSPNGQYIAYLDAVAWELPTRLWIMRAEGTEDRCLVRDDSGQTKVKSFLWHPHATKLFYVVGPTHGTVSVGGSLYSTDLEGNQQIIVPADPAARTEVFGEFRIADDKLHYRIARFDENRKNQKYTLRTLNLSRPPQTQDPRRNEGEY